MAKPKSVLFFLPYIYPCQTGGMEVFNHCLVTESGEERAKLLTCCNIIDYNNKKVISERIFGLRKYGFSKASITIELLLYLLFHRKEHSMIYASYTSKSGYLGITLSLAKLLFGIPYVVHNHGGGLLKWKPAWTHKLLFKNSMMNLAVSEEIKLENEKRTKRENIISLPLVRFKTSKNEKLEIRERLKIGEDSIVILFVGSLKQLKSPETLLKAFISLGSPFIHEKKLELVFAGKGPLKSMLEDKAKLSRLEDKIHMKGLVSRELIPDFYKMADVFVIPSHFEGTPLSLLEAMSNGLACAGTNVNGIKQVIQHAENGLLVEKDDSSGLASTLKELVLNEDLRLKLGKNARANFYEKYNYNDYLDNFYAMLNSRMV